MKTILKMMILLSLLMGSFNVLAKQYDAEVNQLCEKLKSCVVTKMSSENLSPKMQQMMQPMMDKMCKKMLADFDEVEPEVRKEAAVCLRSMSALSCKDLMSEAAETKECAKFNEKHEK